MPQKPREIACAVCGKTWMAANRKTRFCSPECWNSVRELPIHQRVCARCGKGFEALSGRAKYCRTCQRTYQRGKSRRNGAAHAFRSKYGITVEDFERIAEQQGGKCAICGRLASQCTWSKLVVDHCHKTGRVRALLCDACNKGIGTLGDDPNRLRAAAEYLERHMEDPTNAREDVQNRHFPPEPRRPQVCDASDD